MRARRHEDELTTSRLRHSIAIRPTRRPLSPNITYLRSHCRYLWHWGAPNGKVAQPRRTQRSWTAPALSASRSPSYSRLAVECPAHTLSRPLDARSPASKQKLAFLPMVSAARASSAIADGYVADSSRPLDTTTAALNCLSAPTMKASPGAREMLLTSSRSVLLHGAPHEAGRAVCMSGWLPRSQARAIRSMTGHSWL